MLKTPRKDVINPDPSMRSLRLCPCTHYERMAGAGRHRKRAEDPAEAMAAGGMPPSRGKKQGGGKMVVVVVVVCLMTVPLLVFLMLGGRASVSTVRQSADRLTAATAGSTNASDPSPSVTGAANGDELFGGLLAPAGFDRGACLSRHQSPRYYKNSPFAPSSYLLQKLRYYEARHRMCGPGTPLYAKSVEQLRSGRAAEAMECNYLVWLPYNGLGNRMLSLLGAFLYALLTDRVLLIHSPDDFTDLFCEPFPGEATTWVLPPDFPVSKDNLSSFGVNLEQSYGNLLVANKIASDPAKEAAALPMPPYVYLHLAHDLRDIDQRFYCNDDQLVLAKVNWLMLQTDLYFVPSLYALPEFQDELQWLFPAKESVTHLLGRYLFRPSNSVWGMVKRFYHSYLAPAEKRIGVQIRVFPWAPISVDDMYKKLLACSRQERILPDTDDDDMTATNSTNATDTAAGRPSLTAILVASLQADYYERMKSKYYQHAAANGGGWVGVFQPSHEEQQETWSKAHNQKALAEIYLLSFSDVLLTSGVSTFGYMSSTLAGLRPAMLLPWVDLKVNDTPCVRTVSMEPCLHKPPTVKCQGNAVNENVTRHIKPCEDFAEGIKLFD